ncbi:MAG: Mitochondrial inner membrane protease atp23 [Peltula sp. TS41687]|nr:MAG: Mitochondrial inner membrane protease atp23 [Peltula sp. TS41687]
MDGKPTDPSPSSNPLPEKTTTTTTETGYIPGNDAWTRWRNTFMLLTGRLTDEGRAQYRHDRDTLFEKQDCQRCEKHRDYLLQYSPIIRFLNDKITALNGDLNPSNIRCVRCVQRRAGAFSPDVGIELCANELRDRAHAEDTLAHEMVHAYDHLRFKVDFENLRHTACSEIRAASLSGECRFVQEFFTRAQRKVTQQHQECVRRKAALAVRAHPSCQSDVQAVKMVNQVWDSCFADTRPFDEIYR